MISRFPRKLATDLLTLDNLSSSIYRLIRGFPSALPSWVWALYSFDCALHIYTNGHALLLQDLDASISWKAIIWHQILCLVAMPVVGMMESIAVLSAIVDTPNGFEVISK